MFPPTDEELQVIIEDLKNEVKRKLAHARWRGGTIPSHFKPYYAEVDSHGNLRKLYYHDGNQKEFFDLNQHAQPGRPDGQQ